MQKSLRLSSRQITALFVSGLIAANVCEGLLYATHWRVWQLPLLLCLAFLPGTGLLRILHAGVQNRLANIVYAFGLSILVLMLGGLGANQLLFAFGDTHPLNIWGALGGWDVLSAGLILANRRLKRPVVTIEYRVAGKLTWALVGSSLLLPCLVVLGAIRLNNGYNAGLSLVALGYGATLAVAVMCLRRRLGDEVIAWTLFVIGLSVLLMTSLRGWDIVGHDIEREFNVYTLTHNHQRWSINYFRDPYNACLSITILPQMLGVLLRMSGIFVFKVLLQIIFAACPVIMYVLFRKYLGKLAAIAGCVLFICYPTFINDSAMLTRQGVAYTFFALALLTMSWAQSWRGKTLFLLCAAGTVLSHYSTSYMFVALFALAVACKYTVLHWYHKRSRVAPAHLQRSILLPLFAVLLFLMTFGWYAQITGTANGLFTTVRTSVAQIPSLASNDGRSSDTSAALLFSGNQAQANLYNSYLSKTARHNTTGVAGFDLTDDVMPLTTLGKAVKRSGVDPASISAARQYFAQLLQVLAVAGVTFVMYQLLRRRLSTLSLDFVCLNVASLVLLGVMVALPILSVNYGILRAFQQALIFLALPIMLLLTQAGKRLPRGRTALAAGSMALLFLLFTGFFAQILGGSSPSLSLNNNGLYYGLYYASAADTASFTWMSQHIAPHSDVRAANFNRARMHWPSYPFRGNAILPTQLQPQTFVYLDSAQVQQQKLFTYYQSSPLILTFPPDYYDATKNRIFSTPTTRVYQ